MRRKEGKVTAQSTNAEPPQETLITFARRALPYLLKYVQAASANKTTAVIQSDESLIPVFLAMVNH